MDGRGGDAALTPDSGVVNAAGVSTAYGSPDGVVVHRWRGDGTAETAVDPDGTYTVYSARAGCDVVIDELVVFEGGSGMSAPPRYKPHSPTRVLDTRIGFGARRGPVGGTPVSVRVAGEAGVASSVRHVLLTVTAVPSGTRAGYVRTSAPHDPSQEVTALNFPHGVVTSNTVWAQLDSAGNVRVRVGAGASHVLLDVVGAAS